MKRLLLILVAFLLVNVATAQDKGVKFETGTLSSALKKAKKGGKAPKMVFLDCYTSWCGPCKMMAKDVFTLEHVGDYFNINFVNIKIDMEKGEGPALAKKYKVAGYPTFLILDGEGNEMGRVVGGDYPDKFIQKVKDALDPKKQPEYLKVQYEANKNLTTGLEYLSKFGATSKEYSALVNDMYFALTDKEKFSETFFDAAFRTFKSLKEPILVDMCMKKFAFDRQYGSNFATAKLKNYFASRLSGYCSSTKKTLTEEEIVYGAMILGVLSSDPKDPSSHYGNIALLVCRNDVDGIITYYKRYAALVPGEARGQLNKILLDLAADEKTTSIQKEEIKKHLTTSASVMNTAHKTLVEKLNKL